MFCWRRQLEAQKKEMAHIFEVTMPRLEALARGEGEQAREDPDYLII